MRPVTRIPLRIACAGLAACSLALAADIIRPDIKPGLWEVATTPQVSGQMPIPEEELAKMPPERRAQVEAALQATMGNANKPRVYRDCMTPEKIARGFDIDKKEAEDASCKRTVIKSSASELQLHDVCDNPERKSVSDVHFQISGGTQMTGTISVVMSSGARSMTYNSTLKGKWLGASCGNVKDTELEK